MSAAYNAADPVDVAAAGQAHDWRKQADVIAMAKVLVNPDGQRVLGLILKACHLYDSSLAADPFIIAKLEGERHIGLKLRGWIEAVSPGAYDDLNRALAQLAAQEKAEAERLAVVSREKAGRQAVNMGTPLPPVVPRVEGSPG